MKFSDLNKPMGEEAMVLREVNTIYMANREEFETTTVCRNGRVIYVRGEPPQEVKRQEVPEWKVNQLEANIRAVERAYRIK